MIFGQPLLERLMLTCERAGIKRFFIQSISAERDSLDAAMGRFAGRSNVAIIDSLAKLNEGPFGIAGTQSCLMITGNLVFSRSQLAALLNENEALPAEVVSLHSVPGDGSGTMLAGPLAKMVAGLNGRGVVTPAAYHLPFALNSRPEDCAEAEVRLAKSLRHETVATDGVLARLLDRRVSWRVSLRLARTAITPNQITVLNTLLGFFSAFLFATGGYWSRIFAAILFLVSVTFDGVDGEVARLKMAESKFGKTLDVLTDNIVNIAVFIGLMIGCYRASGSSAYFYLLGVLLIGFGLCAVSVNRALSLHGPEAEEWLGKIERLTGRDFAYILLILAIINQLPFFCWGAAFGTYVFALTLWWLTDRRTNQIRRSSRPGKSHAAAEEV
ncbi:MAG: CDP-alcohol phosphatidyltransferase family protein [Candidatus Binataceae bacterium]